MFRVKFIAALVITACLIAPTFVFAQGSSTNNFEPQPPTSWSGFYLGGHAGIGVANLDRTRTVTPLEVAAKSVPSNRIIGPASYTSTFSDDMSGAIYGIHGGYNFQSGAMVFGIEGTFSGTNLNSNASECGGPCETSIDWTATIVARLGLASDKTLFYILGGVAFAGISETDALLIEGDMAPANPERDTTETGFVVGLGIEHAISNNVFARVEYNHMEFSGDTRTTNTYLSTVTEDRDVSVDVVKIGFSVRY